MGGGREWGQGCAWLAATGGLYKPGFPERSLG